MSTCRYCGKSTVEPKSAMPSMSMRTFATAKLRRVNILRSTMGLSTCSSQNTNDTSATAATMLKPMMNDELNQSSSWPLSSTTSRQPRPVATRPRPAQSTGPDRPRAATRCGGSVTKRLVSSSETRPTGTLMKKIQRQLKLSVM